jgi:arginyl-tRNA synthetase
LGEIASGPLTRLSGALSEIAGVAVELARPSDPEHGDYATNVALRLAGIERRPAPEIAADIAAQAVGSGLVMGADAAGPGFVNLRLPDRWFADAVAELLRAGDEYGAGSTSQPERIQVEMVSANPTGPLTVGSGRNGAFGDSIARLLTFAGHDVSREYYYNDSGAQVDSFRASVEAVRNGEEPPEDGYQGAYVAEVARLPGDPVAHVLEAIERTLERFRVHFDTWERQSEIEVEIPEAIALLDAYEEEGALWARTSARGDDKDRVLVRSDGTPTYFAADAAYVRSKYAKGFERLVYILGADHHGYVARLQALAEMLGYPRSSIEVLIYQLVSLVEGGEAKTVSKRRGDVVLLDELMDEIGVDAARWYLVSRGHDQAIEIDVDLAAEKTQKNPVYYVQYAHARIAGVLRNAGDAPVGGDPTSALEREERELVKRLLEFPGIAAEAAERRAPHAIPTYAIRLADDFHRFYHQHRVLESGSRAFRLGLCRATQLVIARCLGVVGVEAPERM